MTTTIIITFCSLLLIAYLFSITASKTKIPSVILLLLLGWGIKEATIFLDFKLPNFANLLPVLATIGLILIVLEGSLELKLSRSKLGLIGKSFFGALLPMIGLSFLYAYAFQYYGGYNLKESIVNAIPLCVISSAIAIPSARNLSETNREFVTYESSISDIIGVVFFNFIALNEVIDATAFGNFGLRLLILTIVSLVATVLLAILLSKITYHIKFVPIILLVILLYTILKAYHLPALIFILLFGLSLGNINLLERFKWFEKYKPEILKAEVKRFKDIAIEGAFLIRALFFMLFGYLLETPEILNPSTFVWAVGITGSILVVRIVQLAISRLPIFPLLFVAPRGLITILLFFSILPGHHIALVNKSLIIQVIILTALVMTFGLMVSRNKKESENLRSEEISPSPEKIKSKQTGDPT